MEMEYTLPITLQELIYSLIVKRDITSWRIYGDKQITVSIRFDENVREIKANHEQCNTPHMCQSANYRRKSPCTEARDTERLVSWASRQGVAAANEVNNKLY